MRFPVKLLSLLASLAGFLCKVLLLGWGAGAIYWSNLPWAWLRTSAAVLFALFGVWTLWFSRQGFRRFAIVFAVVTIGWMMIPPTHDRQWAPDVAVMPKVEINGDRVTLRDVRNFSYRSKEDFTPRYETREVDLSHLKALDLFVSYGGKPGPMAHTFVSFEFDNAPPVCISIEARRRLGDRYRAVASCFKQFELIYVIGDERDIVGVRTNHRHENVYMFRVKTKPENLHLLFRQYLARATSLVAQPEFYHLLSNNCTLNIHKHLAEVRGPAPWDWAMLLNGWTAKLAYQRGGIDTSMPYDDLMKASLINGAAQAAGESPDFSARIRAGRPGF